MRTRFAPSPTGFIHLGNVRTALICYLHAKRNGGQFMLRIDDTDSESCSVEYIERIKEDLKWLGLEWDVLANQSERFDRYNEVLSHLLSSGRVYKCYETPAELEMKRKMLISRGLPPIYSRPTEQEIQRYEEQQRKYHLRFAINKGAKVTWNDKVKGDISFLGEKLSDPVIMRTNGLYTYMLPSVIDDMDYGITDVIRGEDHIANTAIQIEMMDAINAKKPNFAHLSLLRTGEEKLSKSKGGGSIRELEEIGIEPMAINSYLATAGSSQPIKSYKNLRELIEGFEITNFSTSSILLDLQSVKSLNDKVIRNISFSELSVRLQIEGLTEDFWCAIKHNIKSVPEVYDWWAICKTKINPVIKEKEFIGIALENLPSGDWDEGTWGVWVSKLKEISGRKGKNLFLPLRLALTGSESGPELAKLLPLIGRERAMLRLSQDG